MSVNARTIEQGSTQYERAESFRPSKKLALFALVILSGVFLVSVLFAPPGGDYFTICGIRNFTGLPCPGCGLTHSFCAIGKGQITSAAGYNLLGLPLFLLFIFIWIRSLTVLLNGNRFVFLFDQFVERFRLVRAFTFAFIVFGIARILYALFFQPEPFKTSPLMKWISAMFG
ncbi:MAG: DUF2752 domain-containing protein [Blastocatellia bacterium]